MHDSPVDLHPTAPIAAGAVRRGMATLADMVVFSSMSAVLLRPLLQVEPRLLDSADVDRLIASFLDPSWISHASGTLGMWIALWWAYFIVGWGLLGATPGKWACGLRVIDHGLRCPIGPVRATLRLVAYCVSSSTFGIGHAMILLRRDRCALHDLLAGTRVVPVRELRRLRRASEAATNPSDPGDDDEAR